MVIENDGAYDPEGQKERYRSFARSLEQNRDFNGGYSSDSSGSIFIAGGGFGVFDILPDTIDELSCADVVLYCLADPISKVFIQRQRPDAIDLGMFYKAGINRYETYVQMAEAMLQPARQGKRVLSIYYGHPGIFAMPTHRASSIARKEGIPTKMRPGISALDYLIADAGFDPAYPGLVSYEATDMVLRNRALDPHLHLVVWQIGVVGEMGRAKGQLNQQAFDVFIDSLMSVYGNAPAIHYIGSGLAGFESTIEHIKIDDLRSEAIQRGITASSTLYIPPTQGGTNVEEAANAMGLRDLSFTPNSVAPVFDRTQYRPIEHAALSRLGEFALPVSYSPPHETPTIGFLLDTQLNASLRKAFVASPERVLSAEPYAALSPQVKELLSTRTFKAAYKACFL